MKIVLLYLATFGLSQLASGSTFEAEFQVRVPYGTSIVEYNLDEIRAINPIEVLYRVEPGCPMIPSTEVEIQYENSSKWQETGYAGRGRFYHHDYEVRKVRLQLAQFSYQFETCRIILKGGDQEQPKGYIPAVQSN